MIDLDKKWLTNTNNININEKPIIQNTIKMNKPSTTLNLNLNLNNVFL